MRRRWPWLLGWGVLTLLVLAAFREVAWDQALRTLAGASPAWISLAVAANGTILVLAAWEWIVLLPPGIRVGFARMFWITAVTSTVSNGGPFLAGHAAGVHLLATRGGTGHATAVSVKALDQLAEGIAKLFLVGVAVAVAPLSPGFTATALTLLVGVPLLAVGLLVAAHRAHVLDRWAATGSVWRRRSLGFLAEVARQLETLKRPGHFSLGVILALTKKVVEFAAIAAVVAAIGVPVPLWGILLSLTAVNLSTMASVTPANLGIYEASAAAAFRAAGLDTETALGLAVLQHLAYLAPLAGTGWLILLRSGIRPGPVS